MLGTKSFKTFNHLPTIPVQELVAGLLSLIFSFSQTIIHEHNKKIKHREIKAVQQIKIHTLHQWWLPGQDQDQGKEGLKFLLPVPTKKAVFISSIN